MTATYSEGGRLDRPPFFVKGSYRIAVAHRTSPRYHVGTERTEV